MHDPLVFQEGKNETGVLNSEDSSWNTQKDITSAQWKRKPDTGKSWL